MIDAAAGVVTVLILAAFLVFFFLRDGDRAWFWMFQAMGDQKRERITAGRGRGARARGRLPARHDGPGRASSPLTDLVFMGSWECRSRCRWPSSRS